LERLENVKQSLKNALEKDWNYPSRLNKKPSLVTEFRNSLFIFGEPQDLQSSSILNWTDPEEKTFQLLRSD